jgi:hypothetical protein
MLVYVQLAKGQSAGASKGSVSLENKNNSAQGTNGLMIACHLSSIRRMLPYFQNHALNTWSWARLWNVQSLFIPTNYTRAVRCVTLVKYFFHDPFEIEASVPKQL